MCIVMMAITLSSTNVLAARGKAPPALGQYEWLRDDGLTKGWEFQPNVDYNLIGDHPGEGTLYKVLRAYKVARQRIERELNLISGRNFQKKAGDYHISSADYQALRMDAILVKDNNGNLRRLAFPVEMKATVNIQEKANTFRSVEVQIDLDSPFVGYTGEGPRGPHVGYQVKKPKEVITGHVLIDANPPKGGNPCPRLLPDRDSIKKDSVVPAGVGKIRTKSVLEGVEALEAIPNGVNLNLYRVPMTEGAKDAHFTANFYLNICQSYLDNAAMNLIPRDVTFD
ncbi:uncharacterized protein LOC132200710 [Neocloeon triangulifer]|uniref:uncharacterized protein LOC132200710 n=1 Tax=Neocloeon triangulifer TaxID=2078957 RepID=UPI00286EC49B|nr:uncharacterized protein LOC132200710 [Neocloeon triangulifer]